MKRVISFFIMSHFISITLTSQNKATTPKVLNCEETPNFKFFQVQTNLNENSNEFTINIIKNCQVDPKWKVKEETSHQCEIPHRVFEGEDNIRRPFRFIYQQNPSYFEKITIKSIKIDYPSNVADSVLTQSAFSLYPGDYYDTYIEYDCLDIKNSMSDNWYKLRVIIEFGNGRTIAFEYMKICTAAYADKFDFSHCFIIGIIFLVIYASSLDRLNSKLEDTIVKRFTEIKNPENLIIIALVIGIVLIFLFVVGLLNKWAFIAFFIVGPFSIGMLIEAILDKTKFMAQLASITWIIPYFGPVTLLFLISLCVGYATLVFWTSSHSWIINNIFAISISIITIRAFKFPSFKFILSTYFIVFIYECLWVHYNSSYYRENFKLTNLVEQNLPIRILCPELISSPFSACNSLSIADIILPGMLLTYSKRFDETKKIEEDRAYFRTGIIGLAAGLIVNLLFYYLKSLPMPSFLFTGPFILIGTLPLASRKEDLYDFIKGFKSTEYRDNSDKSLIDCLREMSTIPQPPQGHNRIYQPPKELDVRGGFRSTNVA